MVPGWGDTEGDAATWKRAGTQCHGAYRLTSPAH